MTSRPRLVAGVVVLAVAAHPTFLTWLGSGLETPLYSLCMVWWVHAATTPRASRGAGWLASLAAAAVATALTRPDGLLPVAASGVIVGHALWTRPDLRRPRAVLAAAAPFAVFAAHLLWRRWFYGAWLPNTYYAKVVGAWPEAGWRYLASFVVEHGLWLWLVAALVFVASRRRGLRTLATRHFPAVCAVATIVAHVGYYTLVVGGDHFGFRPFAFLVPLVFAALFVLVVETLRRTATAIACVVVFVVAGHTLGWVHHARMEAGGVLAFAELAPAFPRPLRPVVACYDRWQAWLQLRFVCVRRKTHATYAAQFARRCPPREVGSRITWDGRPVVADDNVGYVGWCLPHVAVIDLFGLNDWVVARAPSVARTAPPGIPAATVDSMFAEVDADGGGSVDAAEVEAALVRVSAAARAREIDRRGLITIGRVLYDANGDGVLDREEFGAALATLDIRRMAHERTPPPGYVEAFRPNVVVVNGEAFVVPRDEPLTDAEIVEAEAAFGVGATR